MSSNTKPVTRTISFNALYIGKQRTKPKRPLKHNFSNVIKLIEKLDTAKEKFVDWGDSERDMIVEVVEHFEADRYPSIEASNDKISAWKLRMSFVQKAVLDRIRNKDASIVDIDLGDDAHGIDSQTHAIAYQIDSRTIILGHIACPRAPSANQFALYIRKLMERESVNHKISPYEWSSYPRFNVVVDPKLVKALYDMNGIKFLEIELSEHYVKKNPTDKVVQATKSTSTAFRGKTRLSVRGIKQGADASTAKALLIEYAGLRGKNRCAKLNARFEGQDRVTDLLKNVARITTNQLIVENNRVQDASAWIAIAKTYETFEKDATFEKLITAQVQNDDNKNP